RRIDADRIVLDGGELPAGPSTLYVDCTAYGLRATPARPIFVPGRITPQSLMGAFTTFNAALLGYIEAAREDDDEKNRLCRPTPYPSAPADWVSIYAGGFAAITRLLMEPDLAEWLGTCRLNTTRGLNDHLDDPRVQVALGRWFEHLEPALAN